MPAVLKRVGSRLKPIFEARVSWWGFAVLLTVQLILEFNGGYEAQYDWFVQLGLQLDGVLAGKFWQLLTYGFLHGGWLHLSLNGLCLILLGAKLEWIAGGRAVLGCALAGVLGGGLSHLVLGVTHHSLLIGFSGGCTALLLLLTTLSPESRMFPLFISAKNLGRGILAAELLLALMDPGKSIPGLSSAGEILAKISPPGLFEMGHACHFGGGVAGWLFGKWMLRPRVTLASLRKERAQRETR